MIDANELFFYLQNSIRCHRNDLKCRDYRIIILGSILSSLIYSITFFPTNPNNRLRRSVHRVGFFSDTTKSILIWQSMEQCFIGSVIVWHYNCFGWDFFLVPKTSQIRFEINLNACTKHNNKRPHDFKNFHRFALNAIRCHCYLVEWKFERKSQSHTLYSHAILTIIWIRIMNVYRIQCRQIR